MPHNPPSPPWVIPWNSERLSNESVRRSVELASMAFDERIRMPHPDTLQDDRRRGDASLLRRRAIAGLSFIGLAAACGSLCHMLLRQTRARPNHIQRAPVSFLADQRVPHAIPSMVTYAVNLVFAALGPETRTLRTPWVPIIAAGKAAADVVAARSLVLSHAGRSSSGYAVVEAVARVGTCALAIPEAVEALRSMLVAQPAERRAG